MAQIPGWSDDELEARAAELAALVRKAWRAVAMMIASSLSGKAIVTAADAGDVVPEWQNVVESQIIGYITKTYLDAAGNIAEGVGLPPESFVGDDLVEVFIDESRNRLKGIGDDVWAVVKEQIQQGINEGEGVGEIAARVKNVTGVSDGRAMTIARTEVHAAHEAGSYDQALYVDPNGTKTWLSTEDAKTRPTHVAADGQTVPINQTFDVGGSALRYPGDPLGEAGEVINCRCSTAYEFADIEDEADITVGQSVTASTSDEINGIIDSMAKQPEEMSDDENSVPSPGVYYWTFDEVKSFTAAGDPDWDAKKHPRGKDGKFIKKGGVSDFLKSAKPIIPQLVQALNDLDTDEWNNLTNVQKEKIYKGIDSLPSGSTTKQLLSEKLDDIVFGTPTTPAVKKPQAKKAAPKAITPLDVKIKFKQFDKISVPEMATAVVHKMDQEYWDGLTTEQQKSVTNKVFAAYAQGHNDDSIDAYTKVVEFKQNTAAKTVSTPASTPDMPETHNSAPTPSVVSTPVPAALGKPTTIAGLKGMPGDPAKVTTSVIWGKHKPNTTILEDSTGVTRILWDGKKYQSQALFNGNWVMASSWTKKDAYAKLKNDTHWVVPGAAPSIPQQSTGEPDFVPFAAPPAPAVSLTPPSPTAMKKFQEQFNKGLLTEDEFYGLTGQYPIIFIPDPPKPDPPATDDWELELLESSFPDAVPGDVIGLKGYAEIVNTNKQHGKIIGYNSTDGKKIAWSDTAGSYVSYYGDLDSGIPFSSNIVAIKEMRTEGSGWKVPKSLIKSDDAYIKPILTAEPAVAEPVATEPSTGESVVDNWYELLSGSFNTGDVVATSTSAVGTKRRVVAAETPGLFTIQFYGEGSGKWHNEYSGYSDDITVSLKQHYNTMTWKVPPLSQNKSLKVAPLITLEDSEKEFFLEEAESGAITVGEAIMLANSLSSDEMPSLSEKQKKSISDHLNIGFNSGMNIGPMVEHWQALNGISTTPTSSTTNVPNTGNVSTPTGTSSDVAQTLTNISAWSKFEKNTAFAPLDNAIAQTASGDLYIAKSDGLTWEVYTSDGTSLASYKWEDVTSGTIQQHFPGAWLTVPTPTAAAHITSTPVPSVPTPVAATPTPVAVPSLTVADIPSSTVATWKQTFKVDKVGYWSKPEAIWDKIKEIQAMYLDLANPGNSKYSPLLILQALDAQLKTQKPNPFQTKMTAWAKTAKGDSYIKKNGGTPLSAVPPAPSITTPVTPDSIWSMFDTAALGDIVATGTGVSGKKYQIMKTGTAMPYLQAQVENANEPDGWEELQSMHSKSTLASFFALNGSITWDSSVTATPQITSAPTTATPSAPITPTSLGTDDISQLPEDHKQKLYNDFKKQPNTYLNDPPQHIWTALKQLADNNGLTIAQSLAIIDDIGAKKVNATNAYLFTIKIKEWLQTPKGAAIASGAPVPKPPTPKFTDGVGASKVMPFEESSKLSYSTISVNQTDTVWNDIVQKSGKPWTGAQTSGLKAYTGGIFYGINSYLWGESDHLSPANEKSMTQAQLGMRPSDRPILLHRGTGFSGIGATSHDDLVKKIGTTWKSDGFNSSSVGGSAAFSHSPAIVEIEAPPGTPMAWVKPISHYPLENEMLLAAGLHYKILSVTKSGNGYYAKTIVRVRVVPAPEETT